MFEDFIKEARRIFPYAEKVEFIPMNRVLIRTKRATLQQLAELQKTFDAVEVEVLPGENPLEVEVLVWF